MGIKWEYVNVSVRGVDDILEKHMDHLNDWRAGYQHSMVYSFLEKRGGRAYRVAIVMTFRRSVGRFMENARGQNRVGG